MVDINSKRCHYEEGAHHAHGRLRCGVESKKVEFRADSIYVTEDGMMAVRNESGADTTGALSIQWTA